MASMGQVLDALRREKQTNRSMREKAADKAEQVARYFMTIGGGGAAGAVDKKWGSKRLAGFSYNAIAGTVGLVAGIGELAGRASEAAGDLGSGILAYEFGKWTFSKVKGPEGQTAGEIGASEASQMEAGRPVRDLNYLRERLGAAR